MANTLDKSHRMDWNGIELEVAAITVGGYAITAAEMSVVDDLNATAAEINQYCDESARTEVVTTANVLTASESGKTLYLSHTTGFQTTLPAMAAGLKFTFGCGAAEVSSGNHTIISNASDVNTMFGAVSAGGIVVLIDADDTITLVAAKWVRGDRIVFECDGVAWYVSGTMAVTVGLTAA